MDSKRQPNVGGWLRSRTGPVLIGFLAVAGFFLVVEHRVHLFGILPYALLLLCPLLHLFLHGGHRGHSEHLHHTESQNQPPKGDKR